jgi:hypothetical protein
MANEPANPKYATPEQQAYAYALDIGMKIGFVMLVLSFSLYFFGVITPHIPMEDLPKYWVMPVNDYLHATGVHTGWSWVDLAHKGDFANFIGIAFLSGVTVVCYLRILPLLWRNDDRIYFGIAVLEVAVLLLAASGVLVIGH